MENCEASGGGGSSSSRGSGGENGKNGAAGVMPRLRGRPSSARTPAALPLTSQGAGRPRRQSCRNVVCVERRRQLQAKLAECQAELKRRSIPISYDLNKRAFGRLRHQTSSEAHRQIELLHDERCLCKNGRREADDAAAGLRALHETEVQLREHIAVVLSELNACRAAVAETARRGARVASQR
eukprot:6172553-Pleurochrysis_carterae.AAC.2